MTTDNNPLGPLYHQYRNIDKKSENAGIIVDYKTLQFYPKGYTQVSDRTQDSRQGVLKDLWELAVELGRENDLYPFYDITHNIHLLPDKENPQDPNACYVIIAAPGLHNRLAHLDKKDLGYVPARISTPLRRNLNMMAGGRILKVRANWHKKFYTAKIIIGWGDNAPFPKAIANHTRFSEIADEI